MLDVIIDEDHSLLHSFKDTAPNHWKAQNLPPAVGRNDGIHVSAFHHRPSHHRRHSGSHLHHQSRDSIWNSGMGSRTRDTSESSRVARVICVSRISAVCCPTDAAVTWMDRSSHGRNKSSHVDGICGLWTFSLKARVSIHGREHHLLAPGMYRWIRLGESFLAAALGSRTITTRGCAHDDREYRRRQRDEYWVA